MARFVVKNGHKKDTCFDEVGLCAQNIDTILDSIVNTIGRVYVINWKRERNFNFTSYDYCISTPTPKVEMTIFEIHNC
jgi:hypothetical protein